MRRKIHYLLLYVLLFLFARKVSGQDISGTNQVSYARDGSIYTITEELDDKTVLPVPLQKGVHWIQDGTASYEWSITGDLSPISGTHRLKLSLDFSQPCSGTVSIVQFQRWVDSNDRSRMVLVRSAPLATVGIDVIELKYNTYGTIPEQDGALILMGGTVPATVTNLSLTQTRDIVFNFVCSNKVFLFNPNKVILSRSKRAAHYEIICPTDLQNNSGRFSFKATAEND